MNKNLTIILAIVVAVAIVGVGVYALVTSNVVTITPQISSLALAADEINPTYGSIVTLTATLSQTVENIPVTFYINDNPISTINTDSSGEASMSISIDTMTVRVCKATIP